MTKPSSDENAETNDVGTPAGVNHIVLNVYDIEESHQFWTDVVGFKHVGTLRSRTDMGEVPPMRFYSGNHGGKLNHHDLALVENRDLPPRPPEWEIFGGHQAINHIAIAMPDRESWLKKLQELQAREIKFHLRINHGMTHSVYISDPNGYGVEVLYELPRDIWEGDIDAGLNYAELLPTEGPEALVDDIDNAPSFPPAAG